jgi:Xaa-Pro dipeptidase
MTRADEVQVKLERVRDLMVEEDLGAVVLGTQAGFAWVTAGGDSHVVQGAELGVASVLVTEDSQYVVTENIEARRLEVEEVAELGFEVVSDEWHKHNTNELISDLAPGDVAADGSWLTGAIDLGDSLSQLTWELLPPEIERYRALGREVSDCLGATAREIEPGWTEHEIAGVLCHKLRALGIHTPVILIAVDDRVRHYRHPIPTGRRLERYAMLVASVKRHGLVNSSTRLVHFGEPSDDLHRRHEACVQVDACFNLETRPGVSAGAVFSKAVQTYAETGFADEWRLHHQGGATGYQGRAYKANASTPHKVRLHQAFAWNPSITGTKSEDTILVTESGPEVLSPARDWPMLTVEYQGQKLARPDILVR